MSTTPDAMPDIEELLRAALTARADLVRPEDLAPLAPIVELRPRWRSPWVLLATAAVVLLILGVVFEGAGSRPRSDDVAPKPDAPQLELPADVGRDWKADDLSSPARLDLDGDGVKEKVVFLGEPTKDFDGRVRLETTLSTTGEEAYGIAELGTTIGTSALGPIDADDDGDQELVLYYDDLGANGPGGGGYPLVFDLREGLLVQAVVEDPDLLVRGEVPEPGEATEFYEMVRIHDYWIDEGRLLSSRSVDAYAAGGMTLMRPVHVVVDTWEWVLDADGVLRPRSAGCMVQSISVDELSACKPGEDVDSPAVTPVSTGTIGAGERAEFTEGYEFSARLDAGDPAVLVVEGADGRVVRHDLDLPDPRVATQQPTGIFSDGASLVVTSASDPGMLQVLVQDGERMKVLDPVGEITLANEGGVRTWLTQYGGLVTVVADEDGTWQSWIWVMVSGKEMAAFPLGTVCIDGLDVAGAPVTSLPC